MLGKQLDDKWLLMAMCDNTNLGSRPWEAEVGGSLSTKTACIHEWNYVPNLKKKKKFGEHRRGNKS